MGLLVGNMRFKTYLTGRAFWKGICYLDSIVSNIPFRSSLVFSSPKKISYSFVIGQSSSITGLGHADHCDSLWEGWPIPPLGTGLSSARLT